MIAFRDSTYGGVASVLDAAGSFTAFADAFPNGDGDRTRLEWPELFAGQAWQLPFRAYLARLRDKIILVDTGVGPPSDFLPSAQGLLPRAVDRDLVDLVVLTHLHIDHIGWALAGEQPYFRRARYVVAAADYEFFGDRLGAIAESGVLRVVAGECEVAPGLRFLSTPGHTPGHMSVLIDESTLILGDVAVHPLQLARPSSPYAHEADPELAAATRRSLLEHLADSQTVVAAGHFPSPFGRVRRAECGYRYEPC
jgi:glyoxylase-like metal-dependent hydrolase (beta-lactamase superfamily II)